LTVWSWMVTAVLILFAFSILLAAVVLLLSDRHLATSFFVPPGEVIDGVLDRTRPHANGSPMLWLHLFWFFGHPEVYIAILPAMGLTSSLLANFTRRPVLGYRFMVGTTLAIGFFGLLVWGHHMFVSGMNPYAGTAFAITTMAIAVPSTAKVLNWLAMLLRGRASRVHPLPTPMLFTLGFLSFFIAGGLTGPSLAEPVLDAYLHNTYFVVAHFHLIMAMAGMFSLFAAVYYWFPLITGRLMNETLGKWHFWLSLIGAYGTFLPMHLAGLAGQPRHYAQLTGSTSTLTSLLPLQTGVTHSASLLACVQLLFLINLVWSARRGQAAGENPWKATTLEWVPENISCQVVRGPYEYGFHTNSEDFTMQCAAKPEEE
ncbi:MAG TPA: cbb3-type cytochrome c oxidase subunit I, partial [Candidatus Saccharimonadales bacterium]|nr:cbb3-type cytochrome c oxidase subunit I [Candidatus Saccharimonadales bacterium]